MGSKTHHLVLNLIYSTCILQACIQGVHHLCDQLQPLACSNIQSQTGKPCARSLQLASQDTSFLRPSTFNCRYCVIQLHSHSFVHRLAYLLCMHCDIVFQSVARNGSRICTHHPTNTPNLMTLYKLSLARGARPTIKQGFSCI